MVESFTMAGDMSAKRTGDSTIAEAVSEAVVAIETTEMAAQKEVVKPEMAAGSDSVGDDGEIREEDQID